MRLTASASHNRADAGATQVNNVTNHIGLTEEQINQACLRALRCPDPFRVKIQLKSNNGRPLRESFEWILDDTSYLRWRDDSQVGLLWIKGGAGKGKTMMSIGLIEELETLSRASPSAVVVTYFFCQNADASLNTLDAIIKGLIRQLIRKRADLVQELRSQWDAEQGQFTCSVSSWEELWHMFLAMLDRCEHEKVLIIVDALDECQDSIEPFLAHIVSTGLDRPDQVKWLLTSRPSDAAEQILLARPNQVLVSLEMNLDRVVHGVAAYVSAKVVELGRRWRRCSPELQRQIEQELIRKAGGTFLWVSLVCKELQGVPVEKALSTIRKVPTDLPAIYERAYRDLCRGDPINVTGCIQLLRVMMLALRPLTLPEACNILKADDQDIPIWIGRCASFVQIEGQGARNLTFNHQSARDFLASHTDFMSRHTIDHQGMTLRSLMCLFDRLTFSQSRCSSWTDMTELMADNAPELTTGLEYAAQYWIQHLEAAPDTVWAGASLSDDGLVHTFLEKHFLQWLECLGLTKQLPQAVTGLENLMSIMRRTIECHERSSLWAFIQDASRFVNCHYSMISWCPLQVYRCALIFSPETSVVRQKNTKRLPEWLRHTSGVATDWPPLQQTLTGHLHWVQSVAFSPDGQLLASGSNDKTVKVWSVQSGQVQQTLEGHLYGVTSVAFSHNSRLLASGSEDYTIKVWSITGQVRQTLIGHLGTVRSVVFSPNGQLLASGSDDKTVKVWLIQMGQVQYTLTDHSARIRSVVFSPDNQLLASGGEDKTVRVWSVQTGQIQQTLTGHLGCIYSIAFSPDGQLIASGSRDSTVRVWLVQTKQVLHTLKGHLSWVSSVAFAPSGQLVVSGSYDSRVKVWSLQTGQAQQTLESSSTAIKSVAFLSDGQVLASSTYNTTVKLWRVTEKADQIPIHHSDTVRSIAFSPDGQLLASGSNDKTVKVWSTQTNQVQYTLEGHLSWVNSIVFSPSGRLLASSSDDKTVKVWSVQTGQVQQTLIGHLHWVKSVVFSLDEQLLASGSNDKTVKVWSVQTGQVQQTLKGHLNGVESVTFSPDGRLLASGSWDMTVKLWSVQTGKVQQTLRGHSDPVSSVVFSPDGQLLASGSVDGIIKLWSGSSPSSLRSRIHRIVPLSTLWREHQTISHPSHLRQIRFTRDSSQLLTSSGLVSVLSARASQDPTSANINANMLVVVDQWIVCGSTRLLHAPWDNSVTCFDSQDDKIFLGCSRGHVMCLTVDRALALMKL